MNKDHFFQYLSGKTVTFCGIGRSHMPLMELFQKKGALVSARDKRSFEELGENGEKLKALGIKLILGEGYLGHLEEDLIFRTPEMCIRDRASILSGGQDIDKLLASITLGSFQKYYSSLF